MDNDTCERNRSVEEQRESSSGRADGHLLTLRRLLLVPRMSAGSRYGDSSSTERGHGLKLHLLRRQDGGGGDGTRGQRAQGVDGGGARQALPPGRLEGQGQAVLHRHGNVVALQRVVHLGPELDGGGVGHFELGVGVGHLGVAQQRGRGCCHGDRRGWGGHERHRSCPQAKDTQIDWHDTIISKQPSKINSCERVESLTGKTFFSITNNNINNKNNKNVDFYSTISQPTMVSTPRFTNYSH